MIRELIVAPLKAQRRRIGFAFLALLCLAVAQSGFLLAVKPLFGFLFADVQKDTFLFSDILPPGLAHFAPSGLARETIQLYLPIFLVLASLIKSTANYVYRYQQEALSLSVAAHYRDRLFQRILAKPFAEVGSKEPAHWMSIIMNDVFYLQTRFSEVASSLVKDGVSLIASLVVIALYSPLTAAALLVVGPFLMIRLGAVSKRISGYASKWQNDIAMLAGKVLDVRRRFGFIRSQQAESLELDIFARQNESYFQTVRSSIALRASFSPFVEYLGFLIFAAVMALINHDKSLLLSDPTDMVAYLAAIAVLLKPMRNIGEQVTRYRETMGSLSESLKVFEDAAVVPSAKLQPAAVEAEPIQTKAAFTGTFVLHQLSVGYRTGSPALTAENISFKSGRLTAVIGNSGSGKSTFAKAMAGLLLPERIKSEPSFAAIVANCAYVSQFPFMFSETIRNNLLYGSIGPRSEEELRKALQLADVWEDVQQLSEGLETRLSRVHSNLSGGQLLRLSIARGILQNSKILVLDESTASISEPSEERILTALSAYARKEGKTVIAITHRLTTMKLFDDIIWLADGKVVLQGERNEVCSSAAYKEYSAKAEPA